MAYSPPTSLQRSMISDGSTGVESPPAPDLLSMVLLEAAVVASMLARLKPTTIEPTPFQRRPPLPVRLNLSPRADPLIEVIDISDDEEGVNWDLLEKEIDEEEELEKWK